MATRSTSLNMLETTWSNLDPKARDTTNLAFAKWIFLGPSFTNLVRKGLAWPIAPFQGKMQRDQTSAFLRCWSINPSVFWVWKVILSRIHRLSIRITVCQLAIQLSSLSTYGPFYLSTMQHLPFEDYIQKYTGISAEHDTPTATAAAMLVAADNKEPVSKTSLIGILQGFEATSLSIPGWY